MTKSWDLLEPQMAATLIRGSGMAVSIWGLKKGAIGAISRPMHGIPEKNYEPGDRTETWGSSARDRIARLLRGGNGTGISSNAQAVPLGAIRRAMHFCRFFFFQAIVGCRCWIRRIMHACAKRFGLGATVGLLQYNASADCLIRSKYSFTPKVDLYKRNVNRKQM